MTLSRGKKRFEAGRAGLGAVVVPLISVLVAGCVTTGAMREMSA